MPYIRADGNIEHGRHGDGNPGNRLVPYAIAVCFVIYALGEAEDGGVFNNLMHGDDLAEDNIPASDIAIGTDHWTHIFQQRKNFVRKYTRHADKDSLRWMRGPTTEDLIEHGGRKSGDSGGRNRHDPEDFDMYGTPSENRESVAVTRCTSTNYAITAYFCGSKVADNQDVDKLHVQEARSGTISDLELYLDALDELAPKKTHEDGGAQHRHVTAAQKKELRKAARRVFRFGMGSGKAQIDHVWTLVGNGHGLFWWLQSYISEYSLGTWMDKSKTALFNPMNTTELRRRLALLRILEEDKPAWDQEADDIYFELFDVRVNARKERLDQEWDKTLWQGGHVSFDIACQWPLKKQPKADSKSHSNRHAATNRDL